MNPRGMDESTTDDDNASETTEDDPQIPAPALVHSHPAVPPPPPGAQIQGVPRKRPNYRLRYTLRGHTQSDVSAVLTRPFSLRVVRTSAVRVCSSFLDVELFMS